MHKFSSILVASAVAVVALYPVGASAGMLPSLPQYTAPKAPVYTPPTPVVISLPPKQTAAAFFARVHRK